MSHSQLIPCLSLKSSPSSLISRKRKRIEKTVRFDVEHTVIIDTYSPLDYDRGSIFSFPIQYKINPAIFNKNNNISQPNLSLEIPPTAAAAATSYSPEASSSPEIETPTTPTTPTYTMIDKKKKRPRLTVNTSVCSGGPLFFTKLSTNHAKHKINDSSSSSSDDDDNDYLIPITTPQVTTTFSY
jgi:hypothetical protein